MTSSQSRFEIVSRRAFVVRSLALGALVAVPGLACSNDDKKTFSSSTTAAGTATTTDTAGTAATTAATAAAGSTGSSAAGTASTAAGAATTAAAAAGGTFPSGGQLVVKFTYAAAGGGQVHNPFIAVWVEDSKGDLVKTVSLWYSQRDSRYLNELQRWATVETAFQSAGKTDPYDTVSGATRIGGAYSVMWDGTDAAGAPVALGDYFVCVEAAREKGPYELVRGAVTIGTTASTTPLADNGELTAASVELTV
ncbi:MAG: hypothetical protein JWM34_2819 [Ilumatobacteraceae bacterium]|nr:hypothetical protein [Ilumatobacteraceae bacterium]